MAVFSTLFNLDASQLKTEAEVETRLLSKIFDDLGYPDEAVIPKKRIKALKLHDGTRSTMKAVDFMLLDKDKIARIVVEAKDPSINILDAWGQTASYALSFNRDKQVEQKIKWLLISNGHITGLFPCDSEVPIVILQLSDFASGMPPYVALRTYIKYETIAPVEKTELPFLPLPPQKLNQLFADSHDLVWKKEKMAPADAFFEFCKFIFIKIQEDKKREKFEPNIPIYTVPLTHAWLKAQSATTNHPVRDVLFRDLHSQLERAITKDKKKRIFEKDETLRLSASTCNDLIELFQSVNLSSIDEDLNGRMFEVFLAASIRGKALGQYFTPRSVVDFMTRIALRNTDVKNPPRILDACCGTAGFLIEVMAYLTGRLRNDTRLTNKEREEIKAIICNKRLFGVEANERVARIARINMYLHGDGGSHIFHGDGLDSDSLEQPDMTSEQKDSVAEYKEKIVNSTFDIVLTNPPFSMVYDSSKTDEARIMSQYELTAESSTVKSSVLFLNRYYELLKPNGEMLIVLDDTVLNGKSFEKERKWIREKFIILGVHSLSFNAFFKAKANIKTSIIHLKKKSSISEQQGFVFMSISNNVGHDNSLRDTPSRNSLNEILISYLEWQRTGSLTAAIKDTLTNPAENLECPLQYWLVAPDRISDERFDAFFYSPALSETYEKLRIANESGNIKLLKGKDLILREKLTSAEKKSMRKDGNLYRYIEISDVTQYGLITSFVEDIFEALPTRGEYQVRAGDVLLALNNSSRGTVVLVPENFDKAICTSGFLVIVPETKEDGLLLWYALRSESCRKQIYYLAQTASQPELKIDAWDNYFRIPLPKGFKRKAALTKAKEFYECVTKLFNINNDQFDF